MRRAVACRPSQCTAAPQRPLHSKTIARSYSSKSDAPISHAPTKPFAPCAASMIGDILQKREWPIRERNWERTQRVARASHLTLRHVFQGENLTGLALCGMVVCGIGAAEGALLLHFPLHHPGLVLQYGLEQVFASFIRSTVSMETLVNAVHENPNILRDLSGPHNAPLRLKIDHLKTARWMISGFMGFAQVVRCVNIVLDGPKQWRDKVKNGKEKFFGSVQGRIIRLAGLESDCTSYELSSGNEHLIPVFEDPEKVAALVKRVSRKYSRPVYWNAKLSEYGRASTWERLNITREWLVPMINSPSKRLLFLEADGSVTNQAFSLSVGAFEEITLAHATEGFRLLTRRAEICGALEVGDQVIRVLLADGSTLISSGGGFSESLRQRVARLHDVDILIDSTRTLQRSILGWMKKATERSGKRCVVVDAEATMCHRALSNLLKSEGYEVFDSEDPQATGTMPRLVYHSTTTRTVCGVAMLLANQKVDPQRVCALLDLHEGIAEIADLAKQYALPSLPYLCSADIYAQRFRAVRHLIRQGCSVRDVQKAIDEL